jgi:hypothetical protein
MRTNKRVLAITVVLAIMCTAEKCDDKKIKKEFREWNYKTGEMAVACNEAWDTFYKMKSEAVTEEIIKEHGDDPNFTDEQAEELYKKRMADIDGRNDDFEMSMRIIAGALEGIEQSLDAADHIDSKLWVKSIKDILNALDKVTIILNEGAKETENEHFNAALNWIGVVVNGANQLMDMLGVEDDPDDPKDD